MSPMISARRAAEDFARVVDGSQADVADRFADLTATVQLLREQPAPAARPDFVADLRSRLMTAADTVLVPVDREPAQVISFPQTRRRERRLAALTAAVVMVGGAAGVAAAAESALPGDALYPIKRSIESAQIALSSSDAAKGHELIDQASARLDEVDSLISDGQSPAQISHTLSSFERSAADGADLLFVAYQRDGDGADLAGLRSTLGEQRAQLTALRDQAPASARPDFASATSLLSDLDQQARVLCGDCGPDDGTDLTGSSSTPALEGLLTRPAQAAAAADLEARAKALAEKAGQVASNTPKAPQATPGGPSTSDIGGGLPTVQGPPLPTSDPAVTSPGTTVTGGVAGLLGTVTTSTGGGILTPVTDGVDSTLDTVTGLLLGP